MIRDRLETSSYRRLKSDIAKASERRQQLLDAERLSLPSGLGKLAIIVSRVPDHNSTLTPREQHQAFLEEAERLKQERAEQHQDVVIRRIAVASDMKFDFGDPEVTDIILIGHGSISAMWTDGGRNFDWRMAARSARSLKQGKVEQRMCGNLPTKKFTNGLGGVIEELPHRYSVPLGTFAVSNLSNVTAAIGMKIPEVHPSDDLFQPVFSGSRCAIDQIQDLNERYADVPTELVA